MRINIESGKSMVFQQISDSMKFQNENLKFCQQRTLKTHIFDIEKFCNLIQILTAIKEFSVIVKYLFTREKFFCQLKNFKKNDFSVKK